MATVVTRTRLNVTLYVHGVSCNFVCKAQSFLCKLILPFWTFRSLHSNHTVCMIPGQSSDFTSPQG